MEQPRLRHRAGGLAADVKVTATTTGPVMPDTSLAGIDDYMRGLIQSAQGVVPGSARVIASMGDERPGAGVPVPGPR